MYTRVHEVEPTSRITDIEILNTCGRRRVHLTMVCDKGHVEKRLYDNIIRGHKCRACAREQHSLVCISCFSKYTINDVYDILNNRQYEWLNRDDYTNASSILELRCKKCGSISKSNISNILSGRTCRGCGKYKKKTTSEFAEIINGIGGGYRLLSDYITCKDKVIMQHVPCGHIFEMTPDSFIGGSRCTHCTSSKGEQAVKQCLDDNNVKYIQQYKFSDCRNIRALPFDFYLPSSNTCIEYNGRQHYDVVDYFGGERGFRYRKSNDEIKRKYCSDNNIRLITIPYWDFTKIGGIINGITS